MTIVVSDTSPIRALHFLDEIRLLEQLFGAVIVPPAVADELARPRGRFTAIDVRGLSGVAVRAPQNEQLVRQYARTLDSGQAQALALAIELKATLLIDEVDGRAAAAVAGVPYMGVLGVLSLAKRMALIPELRPLIDKLRSELRFRIAGKLYDEFLKSLGER